MASLEYNCLHWHNRIPINRIWDENRFDFITETLSDTFTCSTGGLCRVVVAVIVVWAEEPCLMVVVGVTGRASRGAPGVCRAVVEAKKERVKINIIL